MSDNLPPNDLNATALYLLYSRLERQLETGFKGVHTKLDAVVDTVTEHGEEIAVLKDRSNHTSAKAETAVEAANSAGPRAMRWGIGVSSAAIAVIEVLKHYWSNP